LLSDAGKWKLTVIHGAFEVVHVTSFERTLCFEGFDEEELKRTHGQ
jgi:hypothetical protein